MIQDQEGADSAGAFLLDLSFVVRAWDPTLTVWTGMSFDDAVGKNIFELVPELSKPSIVSRFERVRDLGTAEILSPALHGFLISCPPAAASNNFDRMQQFVTISRVRVDEFVGIRVLIEDVTKRLERDHEIAARLKDPDEGIRMGAAKDMAERSEPVSPMTVAAAIGALGSTNWRIRRKLIEGLSTNMTPEGAEALLDSIESDHRNFGLLNSAVQILQNSPVDATETLLEFIEHHDVDLSLQAALLLGQQKNKAAVPYLIRIVENPSADNNLREHAIEALGSIGAAEAVQPLLNIARSEDFFLAFPALVAIRIIAPTGVADDVLPLLSNPQLREIAAETLGSVADIKAVQPLVQLLNKGELPAVTAATALVSVFDRSEDASAGEDVRSAFRACINSEGIAALASTLSSFDTSKLSPVIAVSGWIEDPRLTAGLAELIDVDVVGDQVVDSLVRHGSGAVRFLAEKLMSDEVDVRRRAARGLAEIKTADAREQLVLALDEPKAAMEIAEALSGSSDSDITRIIIERSTASQDPKQRAAFIRLLGKLIMEERTEPILAACEDPEAAVRMAALEQLPGLADPSAAERLIRSLKADSPQVRAVAARVLANFPTEAAAAALRSALLDSDPWTRYFAVRSLGALNDAAGLDQIKEISENDPAEQVRIAAAEVLSGKTSI